MGLFSLALIATLTAQPPEPTYETQRAAVRWGECSGRNAAQMAAGQRPLEEAIEAAAAACLSDEREFERLLVAENGPEVANEIMRQLRDHSRGRMRATISERRGTSATR